MTVVVRKFSACPVRTAAQTLDVIVNTVCKTDDTAKSTLTAVTGLVASIIAEGSPKSCPITVKGVGPRLRIYCLYNEDGDTEDASEAELSWNPFDGDWEIHLPVEKDDLNWITAALAARSPRFKTYEAGTKPTDFEGASNGQVSNSELTIDIDKLKANG